MRLPAVTTQQHFLAKGKAYLLQNCKETQEVFDSGVSESVSEYAVSVIERFTCNVYGKPKLSSLNEARLDCFVGKCRGKNKKPLSNPSSWPPCSRELHQKILRTNLKTNVWRPSLLSCHSNLSPSHNGWVLRGGSRLEHKGQVP